MVDAARRGEPGAWELLYRRLYPRIRGDLARQVGPAHVDDAVSETMARAVRGIDGLRLGPAGFDGWMFGIARLTPGDREVLELRVVAGLSAEQVAALLHKPSGAVRTAQSRALALLRRIVETDGA